MLLKLAWRNIWRNKRRSFIVFGSVIVGVVAILLANGLTNGMIRQMLFNRVSTSIGHIQVHKEGFNDNRAVENYIPEPEMVTGLLDTLTSIEAWSKRVVNYGLISSAENSSGIYLNGVIPEDEAALSIIDESIIDGEYFTGGEREVLIGRELAEKLNVETGSKIVVMSNTPDGTIGSDVFRITGIFETYSSRFDKTNIYIPIKTAQKMLEIDNNFHEAALLTKDYRKVNSVKTAITANLYDGYSVKTFRELLPLLVMQMDLAKQSMLIINIIIGLALVFGIVNTMLMSVFERIREFGVLMAIGIKNGKLFTMIMLESLLIGIIGTLAGLIVSVIVIYPLHLSGIDLTLFAESLKSFGVGSSIYPTFDFADVLTTILIIPFISVIGAVYPAAKAIRLEPVKAIRYV